MTLGEPAAPSRSDPFVAGASELVGGPLGQHVRLTRRLGTPLRVVLLAMLLVGLGLGYVEKRPCTTHPWANQYQYTHMCYSDVYALYYAEHLNTGAVPYRDHPVEYPVVIGGLMEAASLVAQDATPANRPAVFFDATAALLAVGGVVLAWTTVRLAGRRRPWDAMMLALAPALVLNAFTNWDLAAAALTGAGMFAWSRRREGWAGVLLGLGIATKLYPLLIIGALFLLCLRAGRWRAWLRMAGAAVLAWAVLDVPVALLYPTAFLRFYVLNRDRVADWDSLWFAAEQWTGHQIGVGLLNAASGAAFAIGVLAVALLVLRAPRRPRVAQVGFLVLVVFLLTSKVYSPQYAIWLLPLAVLARPRWPAFLLWQVSEAWLLFTRFYFFIGHDHPGEGLPVGIFVASVAVRDATLVLLAVLVVREVLRPRLDAVRRGGVDDPAGGCLDGAGDRWVLPGVPGRWRPGWAAR